MFARAWLSMTAPEDRRTCEGLRQVITPYYAFGYSALGTVLHQIYAALPQEAAPLAAQARSYIRAAGIVSWILTFALMVLIRSINVAFQVSAVRVLFAGMARAYRVVVLPRAVGRGIRGPPVRHAPLGRPSTRRPGEPAVTRCQRQTVAHDLPLHLCRRRSLCPRVHLARVLRQPAGLALSVHLDATTTVPRPGALL